MRTALVYHEDMTAAQLLWEDPECEIERPERLTAALERLRQWGLEQRCLQLAAREASEAELGLVHSPEYVSLLRGTQTLSTRELQALSGQYDAVYFHPSTFHCARLAVGAALQLVDAVLTGAVHNGLALVRPPGHHSQRAAANGFCVFNNVAIAAKYAKQRHGLHSVLYFSWHRYEHGHFWPYLRESDADAVGQGQGRGFTVNLPWNQVGMGNADYVAAFLHVLLPVAFEFDPELVLISAGFDSAIGDPEGGYHLESLSQSVCMVVKALLGDPALPLSGPMEPHHSALESIQSVRAAQTPHWTSLRQQGQCGLSWEAGSHPGLPRSGFDSEPPPRVDPHTESQHLLPGAESLTCISRGTQIQGSRGTGLGRTEFPPRPAAPQPHTACPHGCCPDCTGCRSGPTRRRPPSGGVSPTGGDTGLGQATRGPGPGQGSHCTWEGPAPLEWDPGWAGGCTWDGPRVAMSQGQGPGPRTCPQQMACPGECSVAHNHMDVSYLVPGPFLEQSSGTGS
ncbi:histone deacetylase 10-like [Lynx pardinus]|uniref:Histone deacetylase 10-like n=1 Tax=Lynx pardinus TaxID=191816 RepID=A0A485NJP8_LYNPA|nr:histone deacetylase 10-like [Lynx pardinus]